MLRDSKKRASFWWTVNDGDKTTSVLVPIKFKKEFLFTVVKKGITKQDYDDWMVTVDRRYPKANIFDRLGKTNTIILAVVFGFIGLCVVGSVLPKSEHRGSSKKSYSNMSESERKSWYNKFKLSSEGIELQIKMQNAIKNSYKYPETVEIKNGQPLLFEAQSEDLRNGKWYIHFKTVAQNGFGVKIRGGGTIYFTATPEKASIDKITVNDN